MNNRSLRFVSGGCLSRWPGRASQTWVVAAIEEPFDPREIKWRVTNTTPDRRRGQVIAYAVSGGASADFGFVTVPDRAHSTHFKDIPAGRYAPQVEGDLERHDVLG